MFFPNARMFFFSRLRRAVWSKHESHLFVKIAKKSEEKKLCEMLARLNRNPQDNRHNQPAGKKSARAVLRYLLIALMIATKTHQVCEEENWMESHLCFHRNLNHVSLAGFSDCCSNQPRK